MLCKSITELIYVCVTNSFKHDCSNYYTKHTFALFRQNMLCLLVWSSQALGNARKTKRIPCYAKLGGQYVGTVEVCMSSRNAYQVLCDIQVQASKLVPHTHRGFEDVMVWSNQDSCLIPSGFAYKNDLTQEETEQVWSVLGNVRRFDMMWDDNNDYATTVLAQKQIDVTFFGDENIKECVYFYFRQDWQDSPCVLPLEAVFVNKRFGRNKPSQFCLAAHNQRMQLVDLRTLERLRVDDLRLIGLEPTSWCSCRNVKSLSYVGAQSHVPSGVAALQNLEFLRLSNITSLPEDFGCLALKTLSLSMCDLNLALFVQKLANMPHTQTANNSRALPCQIDPHRAGTRHEPSHTTPRWKQLCW